MSMDSIVRAKEPVHDLNVHVEPVKGIADRSL